MALFRRRLKVRGQHPLDVFLDYAKRLAVAGLRACRTFFVKMAFFQPSLSRRFSNKSAIILLS
jgi:hypothetical protein